MKNLKGIFLIFFIFFSVFTGCIGANNKAFASKSIDFSTISIIQNKKDIAINSKALEHGSYSLADNSAVVYGSNRSGQNNLITSNNCISFSNKQFDLSLDNLYSNLYTDSSTIGISLLLFQIQPNAP